MTNKLNLILSTDSYKYSHTYQYPKGTAYVSSYIESRGGADWSVFFGLQAYMKDYLTSPITKEDIEEAESLVIPHGEPFYKDLWFKLINKHGGYLPIEIQAIPEGGVMETSNAQVQLVNTDEEFWWLPGHLETSLLRGVWYPSTVATVSRAMKVEIGRSLLKTSDIPVADQIMFKLHDFGGRGATSGSSAGIGGMAHLVNFMGTDTVEALVAARKYYGENVAGFSIPAAEHSTITSWGRDSEDAAFRNMITRFGGEGKIYAVVSDSYNIYEAARRWGNELKDEVIKAGGTLVVRPDSGDPLTVPLEVTKILMEGFGYTVNSKGYRVLPSCVRIIQGDGIDQNSLPKILEAFEKAGVSTENITFGMGGGLLQKVDRDTLKYAMKTSAISTDGEHWTDVFKDPIAGGKTSKKGRLGVIYECGIGSCGCRTVPEKIANQKGNLLKTVFRNGDLLKEWSFSEVREKAAFDLDKEWSPYTYHSRY